MASVVAPPPMSSVPGTDRFVAAVTGSDGLGRRLDDDQWRAVLAPADESLFIVAGPGSGKTTVLALRVLKLLVVDGLDPASIMATTFTRKAATELQGRITRWGDRLRDGLGRSGAADRRLDAIDLNRVVTGTLDALAQQILTDFRSPGAPPPVTAETFVADALMLRHGYWPLSPDERARLHGFLRRFAAGQPVRGSTDTARLLREISERAVHDGVDLDGYVAATPDPGAALFGKALAAYAAQLRGDPLADYARVEALLLDRVRTGALARFLDGLRVVLVDEYQDTNFLQEQIHLALGSRAARNGGSLAVVGDDDQSLYRFRGATVELFSEFPRRAGHACDPTTVFLSTNYRSRPPIVAWCARFAELDPAYQASRVRDKPSLRVGLEPDGPSPPVLGLFRPTPAQVAEDLAGVIDAVFHGPGLEVPLPDGRIHQIVSDRGSGAVGDCAVLCGSTKETSRKGTPLFPLLLSHALAALPSPIATHNPRGTALAQRPGMGELCGLMLECIDPGGRVLEQEAPRLGDEVSDAQVVADAGFQFGRQCVAANVARAAIAFGEAHRAAVRHGEERQARQRVDDDERGQRRRQRAPGPQRHDQCEVGGGADRRDQRGRAEILPTLEHGDVEHVRRAQRHRTQQQREHPARHARAQPLAEQHEHQRQHRDHDREHRALHAAQAAHQPRGVALAPGAAQFGDELDRAQRDAGVGDHHRVCDHPHQQAVHAHVAGQQRARGEDRRDQAEQVFDVDRE